MTKEELKALGLTDEQAEKVFEDYGKNYVPKSQFNAKNDELKKSKAEYKALEESKQDLSDRLKSFEVEGVGSGADLKALQMQLKALQAKVEETEKQRETEKQKRITSEINGAIIDALTKGNAHDPKAMAGILKSSITIDDNGGYVFNKHDGTTTDIAGGVDEWLKANLWAVKNVQKQGGGTNKGSNSNNSPLTKKEFNKMSYSEKVNLYQTNNELYTELTKGD